MILAQRDDVTLRLALPHDVQANVELFENWNIVRWLTLLPFPYARADSEAWFKDVFARYAQQELTYFVIADQANDQMLGAVNLRMEKNPPSLGYGLHEAWWGRGITAWAAATACTFWEQRYALKTIMATVDPDNKASARVLEKIDFTLAGTQPRETEALRGSETILRYERKVSA